MQPEGSRRGRASCYWCGGTNHTSAQCRFIGKPCYKCGKLGHIGRVCRSKPSQQPAGSGQRNSVRVIEASSPEPADPAPEYYMHKVTASAKPKPLEVQVSIQGKEVTMELDTGAAVSLVSEETFNSRWSGHQIQPTSIRLKTYSGEQIKVLGQATVEIKYENQKICLPLVVVEGRGPSLFGRDWLAHFQLNWRKIHLLQCSSLADVLQRHAQVFANELGTLEGYEAKLIVDPDANPRFLKARPVPYSIKKSWSRRS